MTNQEVILILNSDYEYIYQDKDTYNREAYNMAINALSTIEDIKAEIESYEADCILAEDSKECVECDKIVFGSIYNIINKHTKGENE